MFIGRTDAKAETPILWPPHVKCWLIGKDSDAGRDWGQEEKGMTEDEMAGWHHRPDGHESEWTPGDGDGQGGLVCCNSWGCKELDTTEWTELNWNIFTFLCNQSSEPFHLARLYLSSNSSAFSSFPHPLCFCLFVFKLGWDQTMLSFVSCLFLLFVGIFPCHQRL